MSDALLNSKDGEEAARLFAEANKRIMDRLRGKAMSAINKIYKFPEEVAQAVEDVRQMAAEKTDPLMIPILRSEYEDLERKAAALDWLETHKPDVLAPKGDEEIWGVWDWHDLLQIGTGQTLLAAIEVAMKDEGKP